jgi:hypothetical protein
MPLSKTLEKILDRVGTSLLSDVAGVASVAESGSHASSMTSPATPGAERWHGNGVASVSPVRLSHLPPTRRENCVAEQLFDIVYNTDIATPVTSATPDLYTSQPLSATFFTGVRRLAPCLHQWTQEGRYATCKICEFTVPVVPMAHE